MTNKPPKAVFLDRDGTLIRDKNYLSNPKDIEYYPDTFQALKMMHEKGYRLYVITNQSGVGRGYFNLADVQNVHTVMDADMLHNRLPHFRGWGICPHAPHDNCSCRKPHPKLIHDFIERDDLDPKQCWMVGDKTIDAECGVNAGINGAIVREKAAAGVHKYFNSLLDFATSLD